MMKQIGRAIKERRIVLGLTQNVVAKKLNINVSTYSNLEQGAASINIQTCSRIYRILGVLDIDYDDFMAQHGVTGDMVQFAKTFECRTRTRLSKKLIDEPTDNKTEKNKNRCVYFIIRDTDKLRYFVGSHVESIGNTIHKHRVYRFTENKSKAVLFDSYEKAEAIAERLHDTKIRKEII